MDVRGCAGKGGGRDGDGVRKNNGNIVPYAIGLGHLLESGLGGVACEHSVSNANDNVGRGAILLP